MDERFMREALVQAKKGLGYTSPNPAVGAVVVKDRKVMARGYHRKAGLPHAEVEALKKVGGEAPGATLYVTLEPCNHFGRTPPCTQAILKSGIKRVVVGMKDPNPGVTGRGCDLLRENGVEVVSGILEPECLRLNEGFIKFVTAGRPFVTVKSALTLDGWAATATGDARWITNESSRRFVHRLRARTDAVMVGVGTVLADDPLLTSRLGKGRTRDPLRIILDTHLRIPREAKVLSVPSQASTLIAAGKDVNRRKLEGLEGERVSVITCPTKRGRIDLEALMGILGKREVTSILVEGGAEIIGSLVRERLVDKFCVFKAPKLLGGDDGIPMAKGPGPGQIKDCLHLKEVRVRRFQEDILIEGYPEQREPI